MSDQPPRPRLADLSAPEPILGDPPAELLEAELVEGPGVWSLLWIVAGELGLITLLLVGVLLVLILR